MHEMALAEAIVQMVEEVAQGCVRVRAVHLEIGALASVEKDALCFCFESVAERTVAQGARLEISDIEARGRCAGCGSQMRIFTLYDACAVCGSYRIEVISGDEMRVLELEVE